MLSKLESAVDKISEGNARIAAILAKHDERIEQSIKTDDLLIKMIEEVKQASDRDHRIIHDRIDKIQVELKGLSKFRWQVGGVLAVAVIAISTVNAFVPRLLTAAQAGVRIEQQK
jgi:hypothetical protein